MLFRALLLVLFSGWLAAEELPRLVIDSAVDQSKIDFGLWAQKIYPKLVAISGRKTLPERITIKFGPRTEYQGTYEDPVIAISSYPGDDRENIRNGLYRALSHEIGHTLSPYSIFSSAALAEGLAETMAAFAYMQLSQEEGGTSPFPTQLLFSDVLNNTQAFVSGGSTHFMNQLGSPYRSAGGPLEMLLQSVEDFRAFGLAVDDRSLEGSSFNQLVSLIAQALPRKINGVGTATWLHRIVATRENGPDGTFLGVYPFSNVPAWPYAMTAINPLNFQVLHFKREQGVQTKLATQALLTVWNASGTEVYSTSVEIDDVFQMIPFSASRTWPEGGYRARVCSQAGLCDTTFFGIYRSDPRWMFRNIIVLLNGSEFEDLQTGNGLNFVHDGEVKLYPGMAVFRATTQDVRIESQVKEGRSATFSPHRLATPVYLLTRRDQPWIDGVADTANGKKDIGSPGSWISVYGWGLSQQDPEVLSDFIPLPQSGCGRHTSVGFETDTGSYAAPIVYCSDLQINAQVPAQALGPAKIKVVVGTTSSNTPEVKIQELNPGIFLASPPDLGAITNRYYDLITADNPAQSGEEDPGPDGGPAGDILTLFGAGLGPVDGAALEMGKPASGLRLANTSIPVRVEVGGVLCPIYYSGLAPGLIGVYQVNFRVPAGAPKGPQPLIVKVVDETSNQVVLAIK